MRMSEDQNGSVILAMIHFVVDEPEGKCTSA